LFNDGGEIDVRANDPKDKASIDQIRTHLGHITKLFASANFKAPMLIHDSNPPGTATMTRLKEQIRYEFSETDRGARIRLVTSSPDTRRSNDIRRSSEEITITLGIRRRLCPAIPRFLLSR
jgi:hypothetical protein